MTDRSPLHFLIVLHDTIVLMTYCSRDPIVLVTIVLVMSIVVVTPLFSFTI
jgi:hypothetical protein